MRYAVTNAAGRQVASGDIVTDFRGDEAVFASVECGPDPKYGKDAKVTVYRDGSPRTYYARVFGLSVAVQAP